ncbi:MAG: hypothetical protein JW829_04605 [Pirellulales bacterium]|nr:hypothetical protein [Pirellulales bacterium]
MRPFLGLVVLVVCTQVSASSPITARLTDRQGFATFTNQRHPGNRIGYRFHEHTPMIWGEIPNSNAEAGIQPAAVTQVINTFATRPGVVKYELDVNQEKWVPQRWIFYLDPVEDGIDLLLVVQAGDTGLNAYYGIQQCFRMSGKTNITWRREIAETPAFSEYDLWDQQTQIGTIRTSLTHVLRAGRWVALPAKQRSVGARTPLGVRIDKARSVIRPDLVKEIGPYEAEVLPAIDCGLIARTDLAHQWVSGLFWERTSHVTNHHPADCLHSIVNIGNVPRNGQSAIRGKIYWFVGSLEELLERWRRDFPKSNGQHAH